ncbi:Hypothetical predicted protein, partial [Paramuricea clavata]
MTYDTRRAHVISRLYHAQRKLQKIRHLPYKTLCPPVYVRTKVGSTSRSVRWVWKKWIFDCNNNKFDTPETTNIKWIKNDKLKAYIRGHSKLDSTGQLPNEVGHLYWAVFKEDDYDNDREPSETLPFRTQVYVGIAKNGITKRWTGAGTSH